MAYPLDSPFSPYKYISPLLHVYVAQRATITRDDAVTQKLILNKPLLIANHRIIACLLSRDYHVKSDKTRPSHMPSPCSNKLPHSLNGGRPLMESVQSFLLPVSGNASWFKISRDCFISTVP